MQSNDLTYRFCHTYVQWVVPIREHRTTSRARSFTQWLCPLHDAADRTVDDPRYDFQWPQVHIDYRREAGDANTR